MEEVIYEEDKMMNFKTYKLKPSLNFYTKYFEDIFLDKSRVYFEQEVLKSDFSNGVQVIMQISKMYCLYF